jgi:hypothetical protein
MKKHVVINGELFVRYPDNKGDWIPASRFMSKEEVEKAAFEELIKEAFNGHLF